MPTYEYRCSECGHELEAFQSIKADPLKTCPQCNSDSLRRLISAGAGLIFKGSGFYITDYKNGNSNGRKEKHTDSEKKETTSNKDTSKDTNTKSSDTSTSSKKESVKKD